MGSSEMSLAFFTGMPGWAEMVLIAAVGLLIFGRRLPEVGRSLGKGIVEFKRGLRGIEDEVEEATDAVEKQSRYLPPKENDLGTTDREKGAAEVGTTD